MKALAFLMAVGLTLLNTAQARDLSLNQIAIDSINREALKFTGRPCVSGHKVSVSDLDRPANTTFLQVGYQSTLQMLESRLSRFPGAKLKKSPPAGDVARIWLDMSKANLPSAFVMQALQAFEGKPQILMYGCITR